jgi:hypothetical protein
MLNLVPFVSSRLLHTGQLLIPYVSVASTDGTVDSAKNNSITRLYVAHVYLQRTSSKNQSRRMCLNETAIQ